MSLIELRSDTFTLPTLAMREAMLAAPVGDDVYGEDPSVIALERKMTTILGKEQALFVASGTMANQIAINLHCRPGDEVLVGANAHNRFFECGAAGFLSGVQMTGVPGDGRFDAEQLLASLHLPGSHYAPTRLISVENTHNVSGGRIWPLALIRFRCVFLRDWVLPLAQ